MSISTPQGGGNRRPSTVKPGGTPPPRDRAKSDAGSAAAAKAATGKAGAGKGGGRGPVKPIKPVRVSRQRNWGMIAMVTAVAVFALGVIGYLGYQVYDKGRSWQDRAESISGLVNLRESDKKLTSPGQHSWGGLTYEQTPAIAGTHNPNWQNCMGDVYDAPVATEHAVHSLEHGAVWVTYHPDKLSPAQVQTLAGKVRGKEYLLMSPFPGQDTAVALQAWGYQLKVDSVTDGRIDEFINTLRKNASIEQGAVCSGGITATGTTPRDLGKDQPQQGGS